MTEERPYASHDCPYCGARLDSLPKTKKGCPACGRPIYVRAGPDEVRYLLRDGDLEAHEARWAEYQDRRWWIERAADFANEATVLAEERELQRRDPRSSLRDAYWAVANRGLLAILDSGQWDVVSSAYHSMALTAYGEADEPDRLPERCVTLMREAHRATLRQYQDVDQVTHVEVVGGPHGNDCKPCSEGGGRRVPIAAQLTASTLPHVECTTGWCPCDYAPVV